jgi:hypothetical protein
VLLVNSAGMGALTDRRAAELMLAQVDAIRHDGRRRVATLPYPLLAFGLVNLGGVIATALLGRFHLALYGFPAFAIAIVISIRLVRRRALRDGLQISMRPWTLTAIALCLASATASRTGDLLDIDVVSAVGPFLAQATGYWLLGRWARDDTLLAACTAMVVASALVGATASGDLAVGLQFAIYGVLLLAAARHAAMRSSTA